MDQQGTNPPPAYGSTGPVPAASPAAPPTEPPPKYQAPESGPYAQPPAGYYPPPPPPAQGYPQPQYPIQNQPGVTQGYPTETQPAYPTQGQPAGYGATVHQTVIVRDVNFGPEPRTIECPNCHALITTRTDHVTGGLAWLSAGLICLFGCWLGCCLIPFCVPELQDVHHHCPNCDRHIGTFARL